MRNLKLKVARLSALTFMVLALALTASVKAQENFAANLTLRSTTIKTHNSILALPQAPNTLDAFTPTYIYCPPGSPCTLEINMTSELSDISPGVDSLRFSVSVDGNTVDLFPNYNLGVNSTAKAGQIETGTGTWMRKNLAPGWHYVRVGVNVNDSNGDGFTSGYIGDRSLVLRMYSNQY